MHRKIVIFTILLFSAFWGVAAQTLVPQVLVKESIEFAKFSPDGKILATATFDEITLWDSDSFTELYTITGYTTSFRNFEFSHDGKSLLYYSSSSIKLIDISTQKELLLYNYERVITSAIFGPNSESIIYYTRDGTIKGRDIETGRELFIINTTNTPILLYIPNSQNIIYTDNNLIHIYNIQTSSIEKTLSGHKEKIDSLALSSDNRYLAFVSVDSTIKVWDLTGNNSFTLDYDHGSSTKYIQFSSDGEYILTYSRGKIDLWDISQRKKHLSLSENWEEKVTFAFLSPDSKRIITFLQLGKNKDLIIILNAVDGSELSRVRINYEVAGTISINNHDNTIAVASMDHSVKIWDLSKGTLFKTLLGHTGYVTTVDFSPDGKKIASASDDRRIIIWDYNNGTKLQSFYAHASEITNLFFLDGREQLVSKSDDGTMKMWNINSTRVWSRRERYIHAISNKGMYACEGVLAIQIINIDTGKFIKELDFSPLYEKQEYFTAISFNNDGKIIAFSLTSGDLIVMDWEKEIKMLEVSGQNERIRIIKICPNNKFIAFGTENNELTLWNIENGQVQILSGHTRNIIDLQFTPNGKALISSSFDGSVRVWDSESGSEVVKFIGYNDGEWASITPDGYYNASAGVQNGDRYLAAISGLGLYNMSDYKQQYFRPDIITQRLNTLLQDK